MQAGKLRQLIEIESRSSTTRNAVGEKVDSWASLSKPWAKVEQLTGDELFKTQQVFPQASYKITVRYNASVNNNCRAKVDGKYLDIVNVNSDAKKTETVLTCKGS